VDRDHIRDQLNAVKLQIQGGQFLDAFARLGVLSDARHDYALQARFAKLVQSIPGDALDLKPLRIALLATSTVNHFRDVLACWLAREGFRAEFFLSDYDTLHQTILDSGSELYRFQPDIVWLFTSYRDVRIEAVGPMDMQAVLHRVNEAVGKSASLWDAIRKRCSCQIIQNNADLPRLRPLGNLEGSAAWSHSGLLSRFNLALGEAAGAGVIVFDIEYLSAFYGKERWHDARYWYHSKHAFDLDAYGLVAQRAAKLIAAIKGRARRALILDLDNTPWGGIIGDDGIEGIRLGSTTDGEAFVDFQRYLRELKRRGIVLCVCSKNDEATAMEPFELHPDMVLRLEDIAVFKANWRNKADNIRAIAQTLNLGLDAFAFVDDNPAERDLVRRLVPEVIVVNLPEDPAGFAAAVDEAGLFETTTVTEEDARRGDQYRENALRQDLRESFTDLTAYLESLSMISECGDLDSFHLVRATQLINKSNQFHLTTTRYTETQFEVFVRDPACRVRYYKLCDRFGDNGLIAVVILTRVDGATAFIDTWVMSCRVLARTMEEFICRDIFSAARTLGCARVVGKYIPTKKNGLVAGLYDRLGFLREAAEDTATVWSVDLTQGAPDLVTYVAPAVSAGAEVVHA
jgi:FkbH-like protein